jgi:hypothetical protein
MVLLYTFDNRCEAEAALSKIKGQKRLASERDATETVFNLFGEPTWGNFYRLKLFNLDELETLLSKKSMNLPYDRLRYSDLLNTLNNVARTYGIDLPTHWL